ncbi:MAG: DUF2341 domain-containing protein, partial [Kiritimatiellae bacterium]|nr:DUF2341 domain-containing protein [Kiritimatiellia bacterium]
IGADQSDFQILVKLQAATFSFPNANTNGHDLRFTAADGVTLLSYERERHDAATAQAEYWVKLPSLSASTPTSFYVYYTPAAKADGANPANVWGTDYAFVFHMNQANGSAHIYDSTANAITGTPEAVGITLVAAGYVNGGIASSYGYTVPLTSFARPTNATFETWFRTSAFLSDGAHEMFRTYGSGGYGYFVGVDANSNLNSYVRDGSGATWYSGTTKIQMNDWHYAADIYGDQGRKMYLDGVLDGSNISTAYPQAAGWDNTWLAYAFAGGMDEVRLSKSVRSAEWIKAQNASMRDQLLAYGAEETTPSPAWLETHNYRRRLTVTNTAALVSGLANFPILVRLTAGNFDFAKANTNGYDLRFTGADGITLLSYERERHDSGASQAEYWVRLPSLSAGSTNVFYAYFTPEIHADGANSTNVWDADYVYVHHLTGTNGSACAYDSTANGYTATNSSTGGAKTTLGGTGVIDGCAEGPSTHGGYMSLPAFTQPANATYETWFKAAQLSPASGYFWRSRLTGVHNGFHTGFTAEGRIESVVDGGATVTSSNSFSAGTWYYVADIYGSQGRKLYVDGVIDASTNDTTAPLIGYCVDKYINFGFYGQLDEERLSKVVRSEAWIKAQNASMRDQLIEYGVEQNRTNGTIVIVR